MSEIKVKKYLLEITCYPDGKEFQKITPLGVARRAFKGKTGKAISETKIVDEEVY